MASFILFVFIVFITLPIIVLLVLTRIFVKDKISGKLLWIMVFGIIGSILILSFTRLLTSKKALTRNNIYGIYVVDRTKFAGKQADWQYNHYRFEITKQNNFLFHLTNGDRIIKTYEGKVTFLPYYKIPRIVLQADSLSYHIITEDPTLYRTAWSFYYVFRSPTFGNVFFTKGKWKPIDE